MIRLVHWGYFLRYRVCSSDEMIPQNGRCRNQWTDEGVWRVRGDLGVRKLRDYRRMANDNDDG